MKINNRFSFAKNKSLSIGEELSKVIRSFYCFFLNAFFIVAFLCPAKGKTEVLSLSQAINEALENSPKIQKAKSQTVEAKWKRIETYNGFLPSLSANVSYLFDKRYMIFDVNLAGADRAIPQVIPTTNYYLLAQWPLFDGFTSTNRYKSAMSFEKSAETDYDWARFQIEMEVTLLFYQSVVARELQDVSKQNVLVLENHLKNVRLFRKAGTSTNFDVLRVEVQLADARTELQNAMDNAQISLGRLSETLGREVDIDSVRSVIPHLKSDLVNDIDEADVTKRKDIESLTQKVESLSYQERSSEKYWVPRISLTGQYQYYNNLNDRFSDFDSFRDAYQYGILLTWNFFDGMSSISRSKQSIEQRFQSEKNLTQARLKAKRDFSAWKRKYIYFCQTYEARQENIKKSEESVRLALDGQRAGSRTNSDVLDAEAELYRAKAGALNAQLGAIEALLNLELSIGKKIVDISD
ncbi:MAG: TolC family protein [Bdellovibrio sp.]